MNASKKCPHCQQWSAWAQNPEDRCEHCQHILDPVTMARQQAREERNRKEKERFAVEFIRINTDDAWYLQFIKRIGLGFQIAFVSIVSLFIWFITLLAG